MEKINCVVVDDEELARILLQNYISKLPYLNLVGLCKNPLQAGEILQNHAVDLMFLDIQMPELTGVEFLKSLKTKPAVVFTTAYPNFALEGYQLDVLDYLLKPFSLERFNQAVNKAIEWIELKRKAQQNTENLDKQPVPKSYLTIKADHKLHKIWLNDLLFVQSMREYVAFYTPQGRVLSLGALKNLETELPDSQFIRVHKSYIVNISKVTTLEGNQLIIGKEKIPIGALYKEIVLQKIF